MKSKLEILEAIKENVCSLMESDSATVQGTEELIRINSDLENAIRKEREQEQVELFEQELGK